jgi:acyl carrier protein
MSTLQTIKDVVEKIKGVPGLAAQLPDSADLVNGARLDSLDILQFMLEIEARLSIRIDFEKLEFTYLHSLQRLAAFLETMPAR